MKSCSVLPDRAGTSPPRARGRMLLMLTVAVLLAGAFFMVSIDSDESYADPEPVNKCGDNLTWYESDYYTLCIVGTGPMYDWNDIQDKWDLNKYDTIFIDEGVTTVGADCFRNMYNVAKIYLPSTLTSIEDGAFSWIRYMDQINIPGNVETIGDDVFSNCDCLKTLVLQHGVKTIGNDCFKNCADLRTITISGSVESIGTGSFSSPITKIYYGCNCKSLVVDSGDNCILIDGDPETIMCHDNTAEFDWADDYSSCTVTLSCRYCDAQEVINKNDIWTTNFGSDCKIKYYVHVHEDCGYGYEDTKTILNHDYIPSYVWSDDGHSCTVNFVCSHNEDHTMSVEPEVSSSVKVEATCSSSGTTTYSVQGTYQGIEYSSSIDKTVIKPHDYYSSTIDPTCDDDGYTEYTCRNCGDSYIGEYISALGHDYVASVIKPNCTEKGFTEHICSRCGNSYTDDYIDALGHDYVSYVTEPACTDGGHTDHICSRCGDSYTDDYIDALGHDYVASVTFSTCESKGYTTHTCPLCGDTYIDDYTEPLGHDYSPTYDWSSDGKECEVIFVCSHDPEHILSTSAEVSSSMKTEPTFSTKGVTTYSVSGTFEGMGYSDSIEIADIDYVPMMKDGVVEYTDSIEPGTSTDVTSLFAAAKADDGKVILSISSSAGPLTIEFDRDAVEAIGDRQVMFKADVIASDPNIPDAVMILEITLDGATFADGKVTVSLPFDTPIPDDKIPKVYYIHDGKRTDMNGVFENGMVTFTTNHFSTYAIVFEDPSEDNAIFYAVIAAVIIIAVLGGFLVIMRLRR